MSEEKNQNILERQKELVEFLHELDLIRAKEEEKPMQSTTGKYPTICECEDIKVQLGKDGKGCMRCQRILGETKRKRVWEMQGFQK